MSGFKQYKGFARHFDSSMVARGIAFNDYQNVDYELTSEKAKGHKYFVPFDQRYIVDGLRKEDKDNLSITKDCAITNVLFNKINASGDINKGKNYLSLYKLLKKLGYSNEDINSIIGDNLFWFDNFRFDDLEDLDNVLKILGEDKSSINDLNKIVNTMYRYSKMKKILNKLKLDEQFEQNLLECFVSKEQDKPVEQEEIKKYNAVKNNASALYTLAMTQKIDNLVLAESILTNFENLGKIDERTIINYLSVFNLAGLDYAVLNGNINIITEFIEKEIYPSVLYRYVREVINQKHKSDCVISLDTLQIIIENYSYESLKAKYPLFLEGRPVLEILRKDYIKEINAKATLIKNKNKETRKQQRQII